MKTRALIASTNLVFSLSRGMVSLMAEAEPNSSWAHSVNGTPLAPLIEIRVHYGFKFTLAHAPAITARNI